MAQEDIINQSTGNLDKLGQTVTDIAENDARYLKLDQSTAQTVTGGKPIFQEGIATDEIKTDTNAPADLTIVTGADKTVVLDTPVYDDLQFAITAAKTPADTPPNWEAFTASTYEFAFDVNEYVYTLANEVPHGWKLGTAGHAHLHLTTKTAQNTGEDRYAKFEVIAAYADVDEVWAEQTLTGEYLIPTGTAALTNLYVDLGDLALPNNLIGTQIKLRVKRIAATTGTEYADDVYITQIGIHFENDTAGSRLETAK